MYGDGVCWVLAVNSGSGLVMVGLSLVWVYEVMDVVLAFVVAGGWW